MSDDTRSGPELLTLTPIGVVHSPHRERVEAPRQPAAAKGIRGVVALYPQRGLEFALADIEQWDYLWIIFWFHKNEGWRPKVLPPRSDGRRRGVLATRSPHRPNPIGLSVVRLEEVRGLELHVRGVDMLDGTPVLDIKPYVPYADAIPDAGSGWLEAPADPAPTYDVQWSDVAREQSAWLAERLGWSIADRVASTLALGPAPHPYRRIRADERGMVLSVKDWRVRFRVEDRRVIVERLTTGYRERELATSSTAALELHRAYVERFGR